MRSPSHPGAVSLFVFISVFLVLAPCQTQAFPDDDVWVTSGIIAGVALGACVVVVLLAGLLTDAKGETDGPGPDWAEAMETAFEHLPLDLSCPTPEAAFQGFCPPPRPIPPVEANGRAERTEETLLRNGLEVTGPLLGARDLTGPALLTRGPEAPSPMPVVIWERTPSRGEDEARSGRLF